jgi:signal transduction histidine kinase
MSARSVLGLFGQKARKAEVAERVNILVVDDLPEKILVYEMMLKELGQNLIMARSGEEALKLLLQHEFAVILLDVNMPGMDGFETATLIRSRKKSSHTPIIFLTAFTDEVRMCQGYATGAVDYLPTPVVPQVLQAKVRVFIELFQMRRQAAIQAEEHARRITAEEADRHKDEFLGMLAHELRNPLGPVLNAAYMLRAFGQGESRFDKLIDIINRQVTHMSRLIDDLLDATRVARGQILLRKERCDLGKIVCQTAEDYRELFSKTGIKLVIDVPLEPVWIEGDATRLAQIIGNLLHNANKFTNTGGETRVFLQCDPNKNLAKVSVMDDGIGISQDMLPSIFDVFRQAEQGLDRNRGGLGLGLALVKGLMELHEGSVVVESEGPGKGSSFILSFPLGDALASAEKSRLIPANGHVTKRRILVIEDNRDAAETIRLLLNIDGHDVKITYSGPEGLDAAREFRPDVILCDIGLPNMDGYEVARAIRKDRILSSTYVIAITGYGRDEDQSQAHKAGFNIHMTKPIDCDNLRRILANSL